MRDPKAKKRWNERGGCKVIFPLLHNKQPSLDHAAANRQEQGEEKGAKMCAKYTKSVYVCVSGMECLHHGWHVPAAGEEKGRGDAMFSPPDSAPADADASRVSPGSSGCLLITREADCSYCSCCSFFLFSSFSALLHDGLQLIQVQHAEDPGKSGWGEMRARFPHTRTLIHVNQFSSRQHAVNSNFLSLFSRFFSLSSIPIP